MLNIAAPTLQELRLGGCRAPLGPQGSELLQRFLGSLEDLQVLELGNLGQVGLEMAGGSDVIICDLQMVQMKLHTAAA